MAATTLPSWFLPARNGVDGTDDNPPFPERFWRVALLALDVAFAILVALAVIDLALSAESVAHARPAGLAALGVLVLGYLLLGRVALSCESDARAVGYLLTATICTGVLAYTSPDALFLLFIVYPQVWFLVETARPGSVWTALVFASSTLGVVAHVRNADDSVFGAVSGQLVGLAFSLLLGIWTSQVLAQNRRQFALIAELEATQAQLADAHHERGVLAERERMAREVHDTLAQGYTSIVMLARTASAQLDADPATARERLGVIEEVASTNLQEARAVVAALSPPDLDGRTLREALTRLADRFERETGIAVTVDLADAAGLHRDAEVVLVRAAQEALSNARRHARATRVALRLKRGSDAIHLLVEDDGVGFSAEDQPGSGLAGLRRRVEQAGGSLEVDTAPGAGTRVLARLVPAR